MNKIPMTTVVVFSVLALIIVAFHFYNRPQKQRTKMSGALKALNLWTLQRSYPNPDIPNMGHYAAFEYAKKRLAKPTHSRTVPPWQSIGPHNMGGRTLAIAFNPQNPTTIYAGSASGGLWRSYSGGVGAQAWEYISTGFPVLGVSSIAFAPNDSNIIYIGTGEVYNYQTAGAGAAYRSTRGTYGMGILKSVDGGRTWSRSLDWSYTQQQGVWAIKVNPLNPNSVWTATTEGVFKSTDAGESWTQVHDVIMATDLVINPVDTNIVIVGCGNFGSEGHGIYRTINGGTSWTKQTVGLPPQFNGKVQLSVYDDWPDVVYASIGNSFTGGTDAATWLCLSLDAGENWGFASTEDYSKWQGWYSHDVAVNPSDYTTVIAVGIDIWKSTGVGANLQQKSYWSTWNGGPIPPGEPEGPPYYSHADHHDVVFHPTDPEVVYFGTDGGVFRSIDGGESFESCNGGYQTVQFYNGFSCSQQDSLLAMGGMQDNGTIIYRGTTTWDRLVIGGDGSWTAIDPLDDNVMYGSWQNLNLNRSRDGGRSWSYIAPPGSEARTAFIAPFVVAFDDPTVIYAGRDIVYKSTTGGRGWSATNGGLPLDGSPVFAMAISHQNSDVLYAATAPLNGRPHVFWTDSGGQFWNDITGDLPNRFITDIAVDSHHDSVVYVTLSGFGSSHLFRSTDSGVSWQDISVRLPDVPANAVVADPLYPRNIYVGNDLGVFATTDGGDSWQEFSEGLPDAVIAMDLVISPSNRKLRLATHGNGAFERDMLVGYPENITMVASPPVAFDLEQNYPNPFNSTTKIVYTLPKPSKVTVTVFNSLGQKIKTLVDGEHQTANSYQIFWDGRDDAGARVTSGTYVYRLDADDAMLTKKMTYIK